MAGSLRVKAAPDRRRSDTALLNVCFTRPRLRTSRRYANSGGRMNCSRASFAFSLPAAGGGRSAAFAATGSTNTLNSSSMNCAWSANTQRRLRRSTISDGRVHGRRHRGRGRVWRGGCRASDPAIGCVSATIFSSSVCSDSSSMSVASSRRAPAPCPVARRDGTDNRAQTILNREAPWPGALVSRTRTWPTGCRTDRGQPWRAARDTRASSA